MSLTMTKKVYLTPQGIEDLKNELDQRKTTKRKEIAEKIRVAKEQGDLSENAEYAAAKEEHGFNEGRILEIDDMLKQAVVIDESTKKKGSVGIGSTVTVRANGDTLDYEIVGSNESDPAKGKISNESPIGRAFLGKKVGESVEIDVPAGTLVYTIEAIN
jgi:transcription elongation factor GreA